MFGRFAILGFLIVPTVTFLPRHLPLNAVCHAADATTTQDVAFRVATDIFIGDAKAPAQQSLTLFTGGVAYDISFNDPNQITMVDPARHRIVLLDKQRKIQTVIDLQQLNDFIAAARKQAEASELSAYLQGASQVDVSDSVVTVGDSSLLYTSTLQQPREDSMATHYAQVADALALLNGRSGIPPFARLKLNEVVAAQKALPKEITRKTGAEVVRCKLHTNWRLSKDDEQKISEIGNMLVSFPSVPATQFFAN